MFVTPAIYRMTEVQQAAFKILGNMTSCAWKIALGLFEGKSR